MNKPPMALSFIAALFCAAAASGAAEIELTLQTRDPDTGKFF